MGDLSAVAGSLLAAAESPGVLKNIWFYVQIFIGFSFIIFVHELGHFAVAKWAGVRVERFAIGFFREIFGFTRGETRYSFNLLPLGGYVKMLGQEDFEVDTTGELQFKDDPRSFANKPVGHRMAIVSAGVIMNLLLAGVLFMIVFLVGKQVPTPRVGAVLPDGPAALKGMQPGDIIRKIEGNEINEFTEISMAVALSKPGRALDFEVEREGRILHLPIEPERHAERGVYQVGITSAQNAVLLAVGPEYDRLNPQHAHVGDRVVEIAGQEVNDQNANEMMNLLFTNPLGLTEVIVERPDDWMEESSPTQRVAVKLTPRMRLRPSDVSDSPPHLLGLAPLMRFSSVKGGGRADLAGIEVGDIILQWDDIKNPTGRQISKSIVDSAPPNDPRPERDIPLKVKRVRTGKVERLVVRPKVKTVPITGKRSRPSIGAEYRMFADNTLRVGSVVPEVMGQPTPAAVAGIPPDALITKVNDVKVERWIDLAEQFRTHAGEDVTLTYDDGRRRDQTCTLHVPRSLRTVLGLGPESVILSVDEREKAEVELKDRSIPAAVGHPWGLRSALSEVVGRTVEIRYRRNALAEAETAEVAVTADMVYPWVGLLGYTIDVLPGGEMTLLRKSNPVDALMVGVKKTYYFVVMVYQIMERMIFSRSFGVENIAGPVGIVKMGSEQAAAGYIQLLFFLAMISANLAVLNFLPLPIVDGGLMIFLIIEKIKGSPISLRIQVATQVVGLILIVSVFLFVTLQDLSR